jgi:glycosyltransferase involved in cell wall biosynthesis
VGIAQPLKIAQVVAVYPPYRGGMGRIAQEYTTRLRRRGHDVHVFTVCRDPLCKDEPFVHCLRGPRIGNAALVPALFAGLPNYDIVHLHYPFFGGAEVLHASRLWRHRQPLVLTYHMDAMARGIKGLVFRVHQRTVLPRILSHVDRILVSSLDYAGCSALASLPEAADRIEPHPFGVDLERFHPGSDAELRQDLRVEEDEAVLLFVATLDSAHHFKGLPVLFEALAGLQHLRWRLVVVGDGPLRGSYERRARAQIGSRVSFVGNASDASLPRYYRSADLHVFPSTGPAEAFGLVALEAAASGIPSIASDLPGVRTVVRHGESGLLVVPGNPGFLGTAIERMLLDPGSRSELGRRARFVAEREFAWPSLIERLESTYAAVVGG